MHIYVACIRAAYVCCICVHACVQTCNTHTWLYLCEVNNNGNSHGLQESKNMSVVIVLQVFHSLLNIFSFQHLRKSAQADEPKDFQQCKHEMSKSMEVTNVNPHRLEALRVLPFQVGPKQVVLQECVCGVRMRACVCLRACVCVHTWPSPPIRQMRAGGSCRVKCSHDLYPSA